RSQREVAGDGGGRSPGLGCPSPFARFPLVLQAKSSGAASPSVLWGSRGRAAHVGQLLIDGPTPSSLPRSVHYAASLVASRWAGSRPAGPSRSARRCSGRRREAPAGCGGGRGVVPPPRRRQVEHVAPGPGQASSFFVETRSAVEAGRLRIDRTAS